LVAVFSWYSNGLRGDDTVGIMFVEGESWGIVVERGCWEFKGFWFGFWILVDFGPELEYI